MRRVIDTLLALVGIALLAPLILLISVCVLIASGRPILFRQWRAGQNGMPFQLVKFRSMRDTRDPSGQLLPDEERVTTIGRLLRSEEHTYELQSLMRISYAVFCLKTTNELKTIRNRDHKDNIQKE